MDPLNKSDKKDKYFKGQQTDEEFICFFRSHWISIIKEFLYFLIFLLIVILFVKEIDLIKDVLRGNRELKLFFFTGFLVGTIYLNRFFLKLLNYFVNVGIITNMRIIDHQKTLFFTDNIDSIYMAQIQNIEMKEEGLLPSLLKFGDIKIFLAASDTIKTFKAVPNAKYHFRCISRQKEERQRALLYGQRSPSEINIPTPQIQKTSKSEPQIQNEKDIFNYKKHTV
ncbi:hypothetical protein GF366_03555 [Candidatus Peregrinibacteria bacterium]|nr:hypothetical protein [Candidatus Peregrinibacteria bacterium]